MNSNNVAPIPEHDRESEEGEDGQWYNRGYEAG